MYVCIYIPPTQLPRPLLSLLPSPAQLGRTVPAIALSLSRSPPPPLCLLCTYTHTHTASLAQGEALAHLKS